MFTCIKIVEGYYVFVYLISLLVYGVNGLLVVMIGRFVVYQIWFDVVPLLFRLELLDYVFIIINSLFEFFGLCLFCLYQYQLPQKVEYVIFQGLLFKSFRYCIIELRFLGSTVWSSNYLCFGFTGLGYLIYFIIVGLGFGRFVFILLLFFIECRDAFVI